VRAYIRNYPYETEGDPQAYTQDVFGALPDCLHEIDLSELSRMGEFENSGVPSVRLAAIARSGMDLTDGLDLARKLFINSRNMYVADEFHLLTLCTPEVGDDIKKLCDAGTTEWQAFRNYISQLGNDLLVEHSVVIQRSETYAVMKGRPGALILAEVRKQFAAFLVMRWIPGIWDADSLLLTPVLDEMMLRAEKILKLCLEMHLALFVVLIEHIAIRLRNGTSGEKNALGCLLSCSRVLARFLYKRNLRYVEQVAGMKVSVLADLISSDSRRRNRMYNTAVAARMIKEAKRLSFAGSAIVPLTK
jgi:hypothetical protein